MPTELRSPRAKMRPPDPSRLNRVTAARIESPASSTHTLHDEPAATYMKLSGPITSVRVPWPPLGRPDTKVSGVVVPGSSRFTAVCSAKYIVSPRNAMPRSEEHTSELQSRLHLVCRLLLEKKKKTDPSMSIRVGRS